MAPCPQNRAQNVNTKPVTNTKKPKVKDDQTQHVVVREAIQKADSTIPSTQSNSQHFIRISSKKSSVGGMNTGLDGEYASGLDGEYASVITEFSDQISQDVAEVAEGLEVPDLQIEGLALKLPAGSRKKTKKTLAAVKPPMPQPPWVLEKKTSSSSEAHLQQLRTGVAFEVQVGAQRSEGKPVMKRKRRRATKKDLDAKQAAASQRRKVCHSMHVSATSCLQLLLGHSTWTGPPFANMIVTKTGGKMATVLYMHHCYPCIICQLCRSWSRTWWRG